MKTDRQEIVGEAFREVIGKFAFMFSELTSKGDLPRRRSRYIRASMTFTGAMTGELALVVPEPMCPEIAANVLGVEPDGGVTMAQGTDALKEVLNVTCGRVLTAMAGKKPVFNLSVPVVSKVDASGWAAVVDSPDSLGFLVDENPVLLLLSLAR
jgi:chemotaxis protein CheY-P-specific phosphatase CheC